MRERVSLAALIVAFAMLWVPVGQHAFLIEHWMKLGTFMAPCLVLVAVSFSTGRKVRIARAISLCLLIAYIVHQFEEHWVDLYGRTYAFKPSLNDLLSNLLGAPTGQEYLSDASVFVINTSLVWLVGALAVWRGSAHVFAPLCMAAIVVVNAISHIGAGLMSSSYNPGLVTAVAVFLPVGIASYILLARATPATVGLILASLGWGVIAHILMVGGILAMSQFNQSPEVVYFAVLIAWSILPAFVFPNTKTG